jgi:peptidoglycan/xylan/chitin deacetylase (PgdA/CDA1 family)
MSTVVTSPQVGALVISLDFELLWGVRDRHTGRDAYARNLQGARTVIPRILEIFEEYEIAATWAVVGFLMAESRDELERFSPGLRPAYRDPALDPYGEPVGRGEDDDPLHFAPSFVRRIKGTPRQEVGTHTYSHYYPGEPGQTRETFRADLLAACAIAAQHGMRFRSIVFPRNQHNPEYDDILWEVGIRAYRGNPTTLAWRFRDAEGSGRRWRRAGRFLDAYAGRSGASTIPWEEVRQSSGLCDVRASCLLRPFRPALRHLEGLRLSRIRRGLRFAARRKRIFHLWWHPHNFGIHQEENLSFLRRVLKDFSVCRDRYGMRSLTMAETHALLPPGPRGEPGRTLPVAIGTRSSPEARPAHDLPQPAVRR